MVGRLKSWYPRHVHEVVDVRGASLWPRDEARLLAAADIVAWFFLWVAEVVVEGLWDCRVVRPETKERGIILTRSSTPTSVGDLFASWSRRSSPWACGTLRSLASFCRLCVT